MNLPITQKNWQSGLEWDQFVKGMQTHRLEMQRRLKIVDLSETEVDILKNIELSIHALVMTEDWCVDSLMNLPILVKIARAVPRMDIRIFPRRDWTELDAYFQERGIQHIPVFLLLDSD